MVFTILRICCQVEYLIVLFASLPPKYSPWNQQLINEPDLGLVILLWYKVRQSRTFRVMLMPTNISDSKCAQLIHNAQSYWRYIFSAIVILCYGLGFWRVWLSSVNYLKLHLVYRNLSAFSFLYCSLVILRIGL